MDKFKESSTEKEEGAQVPSASGTKVNKETGVAESADPFGRSSLIKRTPPSANKGSLEGQKGEEVRQQQGLKPKEGGGDSGAQTPTPSAGAARVRLGEMEEELREGLQKMKSLIKAMLTATKRQVGVSKVVRDGLPALEELVDGLDEARRSCVEVLRGLVVKASATQTSPAGATGIPTRSGGGKRGPSSPPLPTAEDNSKKRKAEPQPTPETSNGAPSTSWTEVVRRGKARKEEEKERKEEGRKQRRKRKKKKKKKGAAGGRTEKTPAAPKTVENKPTGKTKPDAIALKPAAGKTYADVLSMIRKSVEPESCGVEVRSVRQTRSGEVLLELGKASAGDRSAFASALNSAAGGACSVRELVPRASLEIRDLDACTTKEEVEEALRRVLEGYGGLLQVGVTQPNERGQRMAIVAVDETAAESLLRSAKIKIGWVNCRIRRRVEVLRCYKCLGYGHQGRSCKGPDRSRACFRCGVEGHNRKGCTASPLCFLCPEVAGKPDARKHVAGSGECGSFRRILSQPKQAK